MRPLPFTFQELIFWFIVNAILSAAVYWLFAQGIPQGIVEKCVERFKKIKSQKKKKENI